MNLFISSIRDRLHCEESTEQFHFKQRTKLSPLLFSRNTLFFSKYELSKSIPSFIKANLNYDGQTLGSGSLAHPHVSSDPTSLDLFKLTTSEEDGYNI